MSLHITTKKRQPSFASKTLSAMQAITGAIIALNLKTAQNQKIIANTKSYYDNLKMILTYRFIQHRFI